MPDDSALTMAQRLHHPIPLRRNVAHPSESTPSGHRPGLQEDTTARRTLLVRRRLLKYPRAEVTSPRIGGINVQHAPRPLRGANVPGVLRRSAPAPRTRTPTQAKQRPLARRDKSAPAPPSRAVLSDSPARSQTVAATSPPGALYAIEPVRRSRSRRGSARRSPFLRGR